MYTINQDLLGDSPTWVVFLENLSEQMNINLKTLNNIYEGKAVFCALATVIQIVVVWKGVR